MPRLTRQRADSKMYCVEETAIQRVDGGYAGAAIERLARFENFYEALLLGQGELDAELDRLRRADKQKTVKFKESLAQKFMNNNLIAKFRAEGLD